LAGHGTEAVRDAIADAIDTLPEQLHRINAVKKAS
jgi:hypothetical protein